MNEEQIIDKVSMIDQWKVSGDSYTQGELDAIGQLLELYYDNKKELEQEKEKNKELMQEYHKRVQEKLDLMYEGGSISETEVKRDYIPKDKIKAIQGQLIMQLGSYVQNEASPEQERIAGGINIINKILKGE